MVNEDGNIEFDQEPATTQSLTFRYMDIHLSGMPLDFNQAALRMVSGNEQTFNNAAFLVSDQNSYVTRAARYRGTTAMEFADKREFSGSVLKQVDDMLNYLDLLNANQAVITGKARRVEQRDYPVTAVREAVINAFVHRDYMLHSFSKVEVYDDRMEITSPGGIPGGLTLDEVKNGLTAARNSVLVHIMDKLNYIENFGSGIHRIYASYYSSGLNPTFEVRPNSFRVVLPNINYARSQAKAANSSHSMPSNVEIIYEALIEAGHALKRVELEQLTGLSKPVVSRALRQLRVQGRVIVTGKTQNTAYTGVPVR